LGEKGVKQRKKIGAGKGGHGDRGEAGLREKILKK